MNSLTYCKNRRAFALISALAVLALVLVLVLGFAALIRMETRVSAASKRLYEARQNALMALDIAVGQLQQHAGRDQVSTFPATTYYPEPDALLYDSSSFYRTEAATARSGSYLTRSETFLTPAERESFDTALDDWWNQDRQPFWTGVFDGSLRRDDSEIPEIFYEVDPNGTRFGEPDREQLPVWLVSGNEAFDLDPATATAYPAGYFTPDVALTANESVFLVGEGSAANETDSTEGLDGRVRAPLVPILKLDADGAVAQNQAADDLVTGHYAYWVGDESTKAHFAVRDPWDAATPGTPEYLNRLQGPQRVGWENIEFDNAGTVQALRDVATFDTNDARLEWIATSREIALMEPTNTPEMKEAARQHFHSLTANATSLFTDPVLGGLKKDLTRYVQSGSGLTGTDPILDPDRYESDDPRFSVYGGVNAGFPGGTSDLPVWSDVKDWYDNTTGGGSVSPDQSLHPILTYFRVHAAFTYDEGSRRLRFHWMPVLMLWNPYDAPLQSATYEIEVSQFFEISDLVLVTPDDNAPGITDDPATDADGVAFESFDHTDPTEGGLDDPATNAFIHGVNAVNGRLVRTDANVDLADNVGLNTGLTGQSVFHDYQPFGDANNSPTRFTYRFTADFEAGECLLFGIDSNNPVQINTLGSSQTINLVTDLLSDIPGHLYFDALEVVNGPTVNTVSSAPQPHALRMIGWGRTGTNQDTPPTRGMLGHPHDIRIRVNGAEVAFIKDMGDAFLPSSALRISLHGPGDQVIVANSGQATVIVGDRIGDYRRIYPTSSFPSPPPAGNDLLTATSQMFPYGEFHLGPLIGSRLDRLQPEDLNRRVRFFALHNPKASTVELLPHEVLRNNSVQNNSDGFGRHAIYNTVFGPDHRNLFWDTDHAEFGSRSRGYGIQTNTRVLNAFNNGIVPTTHLAIFNARRADSEVLSMGGLSSLGLARHYFQPGFAIGNSEASPLVDRAGVAGLSAYPVGAKTLGASPPPPAIWPNDSNNRYLDLSYLLNENLWDRYFFSTVPTGSFDPYASDAFANARIHPLESNLSASDLSDFDTAAARLGLRGGFNVNSTSVEAWRAMLTSFRDLELRSANGGVNPNETAPVTRSLEPINNAVAFELDGDRDPQTYGAEGSTNQFDYQRVFSGFRYLDDQMIGELARRIVDEVRLRGPFFSVADFVNRRLVEPDGAGDSSSAWYAARTQSDSMNNNRAHLIGAGYDPVIGMTGINGALQRAINLSGINGGVNHPAILAGDTAENANDRIYGAERIGAGEEIWDNASPQKSNIDALLQVPTEAGNHLDMEHMAGAPAGETGHLFSHSGGFVSQADVLNMIGPALVSRGDTFIIRTYGDVVRSGTGDVQARAWLEAVVQRMPDPVERASSNPADTDYWRPVSREGRAFKVIKLRWLRADEI